MVTFQAQMARFGGIKGYGVAGKKVEINLQLKQTVHALKKKFIKMYQLNEVGVYQGSLNRVHVCEKPSLT